MCTCKDFSWCRERTGLVVNPHSTPSIGVTRCASPGTLAISSAAAVSVGSTTWRSARRTRANPSTKWSWNRSSTWWSSSVACKASSRASKATRASARRSRRKSSTCTSTRARCRARGPSAPRRLSTSLWRRCNASTRLLSRCLSSSAKYTKETSPSLTTVFS